MAYYDTIDLDFNWEGDVIIGKDGDFQDTSSNTLAPLINSIQSAIKSEFEDWQEDPNFAVGISEFLGAPNTEETGREIEKRVTSRLVNLGIVFKGDLEVKVMPFTNSKVAIFIKVTAAATPTNNLAVGDSVVVSVLYDTAEDSTLFTASNNIE